MNLVHNEREKLTAAWLNAMSVALLATGFFAPVAALAYGFQTPGAEDRYVILLSSVCMVAGICLHLLARLIPGRLRE